MRFVIRSTRPRDLGGPRWTSTKNPAGLGSVGAFGRHCESARREKTPPSLHCLRTPVCSELWWKVGSLLKDAARVVFLELEASALSRKFRSRPAAAVLTFGSSVSSV